MIERNKKGWKAAIVVTKQFSKAFKSSVEKRRRMLDFPDENEPAPVCNSVKGEYRSAAVVSNTEHCAVVGRDLLECGGSAVDALIGTLLCEGLCAMQNLGLGGGGFMTIYSRAKGQVECLNAREAAPAAATPDMFQGNYENSSSGALSIGVPGELMGYWEAHRRYGRLPWRELFRPAISMCIEGVPVNRRLGKAFSDAGLGPQILASRSLRKALGVEANRPLPAQGDRLRLPVLARTLQQLAESPRGALELYDGSLTASFLGDLTALGSLITAQDLRNYRAVWSEPVSATIGEGLIAYAPPPPASGPIFLLILKLLQGLIGPDPRRNVLLMSEAFKYAFAARTQIADPEHVNMEPVLRKLNSEAYLTETRNKIRSISRTHSSPLYYGARYAPVRDHGTGNVVVRAPDGDVAVATSTINTLFGSMMASQSTGIILNNEMDDFSCPNIVNSFGLPPCPANLISGEKRPMSSACPTVVINKNGDVRLAIGGAGGSYITTSTTQVAMNHLWFNACIKEAVDMPRIHHQLLPMKLRYEDGIGSEVLRSAAEAGHEMKRNRPCSSVTAIACDKGRITAIYDYRRGGSTSGY